MDGDARKIPSHEVTYAALRDMVLFGRLQPGQAVTIQGLIRDTGAGMTPVREAIRRLTAEGALTPLGNRRVAVPPMTSAVAEQVAFARRTIEPQLARRAALRIDDARIARLEALDAEVDRAIRANEVPAYLEANHAFHFALYEASDAAVLIDIARSLWLRFGPALRVVCVHYGTQSLPDLHGQAMDALRARDPAAVARAIDRDIAQGVAQVRAALASGEI